MYARVPVLVMAWPKPGEGAVAEVGFASILLLRSGWIPSLVLARAHPPSIETLVKYARALEEPLYRLFYEGDEPPRAATIAANEQCRMGCND